MMALGMSFSGFFMESAKVVTTSKPMKLNRMMDRNVRALTLVRSGRNVAGLMSLAKPLAVAYQIPRHPTTTAMATLRMAPPLSTHAESETLDVAMSTTIHTKASSMASLPSTVNSMPVTNPMMSGKSVAHEAIHRGKLIQ